VPIDPHENPPFLILQRDKYHQFACQDVPQWTAAVLATAEGATSATIVSEPIYGPPAWRQFPTWYQISSDDRMIQPAAQEMMAARATKCDHTISIYTGHCSMVSYPQRVTTFIEQAAQTYPQAAHRRASS
jgi:pimeloyl-ACP methyl ester carboxylesterase